MTRKRGFELVSEKYKKNTARAIYPKRGSASAIAYDIYSPISTKIEPGETKLIWSDIKAYCQEDEAIIINVRSSMGKHKIMLANTQGWIESDYYNNADNEGNIGIMLYNYGTETYTVNAGDRIAQAMFIPYLVSDNCNSNQVRTGGIGSTGK